MCYVLDIYIVSEEHERDETSTKSKKTNAGQEIPIGNTCYALIITHTRRSGRCVARACPHLSSLVETSDSGLEG